MCISIFKDLPQVYNLNFTCGQGIGSSWPKLRTKHVAMMSLPSIQETVVLINSNFSSIDKTLIKELFDNSSVFRNFLTMKMISRKFIIREKLLIKIGRH